MTAKGNFLYNSLSNTWNMTYDCFGSFPLQSLINIIEIWHLTARGNLLYNSLSKSLKYDLWLRWAISFSIPYQINEIWDLVAKIHFLYDSLPIALKYDLWLLWAISFTIPYQNHWNLAYDSYGQFPLQFLITTIEIWPMTAMGYFLHNSSSKSFKYDQC